MAANYSRLVRQLRSERSSLERQVERLTQAIDALQGGQGGAGRAVPSRRAKGRRTGRKRRGMTAAARQAISRRMKKYWAERRKPKE